MRHHAARAGCAFRLRRPDERACRSHRADRAAATVAPMPRRRTDRGDDRGAGRAVRRDHDPGRVQPAGATGRVAARSARDTQDSEGAATPGAARAPESRGALQRARAHLLPEPAVRPAHAAHRQGRQREAGHHAGPVLLARRVCNKWACKRGQELRQKPAKPDVVEGGAPASGLAAHTLISCFVDNLPYYLPARDDQSALGRAHATLTPAAWAGVGGACAAVRGAPDAPHHRPARAARQRGTGAAAGPGLWQDQEAYSWAWDCSYHGPQSSVICQFCLGPGVAVPGGLRRRQGAAVRQTGVERHLDHRTKVLQLYRRGDRYTLNAWRALPLHLAPRRRGREQQPHRAPDQAVEARREELAFMGSELAASSARRW